jgi:predicted PurR-regulated permease PerM
VIAYFLNPLLNFFEKKVFKKVYQKNKYSKLRRGLSIVSVFIIVLLTLFLFVMSFIPQLTESINSLIENYGTVDKAISSINSFLQSNKFTAPHYDTIISTFMEYEEKIFTAIYSAIETVVPLVISYTVGLMKGFYNVIVGIIFSIYVLCYKEKLMALLKKLSTAFFAEKNVAFAKKLLGIVDLKFGKYIWGKVIDSIIVGVVSYIIYWVCGYKFYPLLALIAGVTNMIPFFGPFIGAVPAGIIVLIAQPEKFIWLLVIILVLQQLDGNILDPMIVGNEVGLIPVFTMSATLLFGDIFGIPGMLLGVPIVATVYTLLGETVVKRLKNKGLPAKTTDYYPQ